MKQRSQPENRVRLGQADPALVDSGREHDVAVRVQRGFRLPRRARRVHHEGRGIAGDLDGFGHLAGVLGNERDEIRNFQMAAAGGSCQHARRFRARGQKVERRGGDRVGDVGGRHDLARHVGVEIVLADQDAAAGIVEDLHELALAQHRIARHDDRAALPGGQHGHEHLRDVLHVHRDAIAGLGALLLQRDGEGVGHRVELTGGQRSIEVVHQHGIGSLSLQRGPEHVQGCGARRLDGSSGHDSLTAPSSLTSLTVATCRVVPISRW